MGRQIAAGRAALGLIQPELAVAANISNSTLCRIEAGRLSSRPNNVDAVKRALEDRGIEFVVGGVIWPGAAK